MIQIFRQTSPIHDPDLMDCMESQSRESAADWWATFPPLLLSSVKDSTTAGYTNHAVGPNIRPLMQVVIILHTSGCII